MAKVLVSGYTGPRDIPEEQEYDDLSLAETRRDILIDVFEQDGYRVALPGFQGRYGYAVWLTGPHDEEVQIKVIY